jgi:hypothetical protein
VSKRSEGKVSIISASDVTGQLDFTIQEILGTSDVENLSFSLTTGSNTAFTLRAVDISRPGRAFFIKTTRKTAVGKNLGLREVEFYKFIESLNPEPYPNIPRCVRWFAAAAGKKYYLVLSDLTDAYNDYQAVDFNDIANWQCAVRSIAYFHRLFLNKLTEEQIRSRLQTRDEIDGYILNLRNAYARFKDYCDGRVEPKVLSLLADSIPVIERIEIEKNERLRRRKDVTITHGDGHIRNFLYPKAAGQLAQLVDWQFWNVGVGTYDLRHLIGSGLSKEMRHLQKDLVKYYYQVLTEDAKSKYSWDDCWRDYKLGIVDNLFMPVWQYAGFNWPYERWSNALTSAVENYYELGCDSLDFCIR